MAYILRKVTLGSRAECKASPAGITRLAKMKQKIFLIRPDKSLATMEEEQYASEDLLQGLLESYPSLLAGEQIDESEPRRWLFISREFAVPDREDSGGRWSIDHLFIGFLHWLYPTGV